MKLKSFHWTRRTAVYALIALAVVLALLVIWRSNDGVLSAHYNVTTTEGRITYLRALGWEADPATETAQEIVLPRTFDGVFGNYNALQKQQGFDLSIYAGETCSVYTYRVMNYAGTSDTVLAQLFFIMALYQALSQLNRINVPYIVDTPFARIDKEHRGKILSQFFKKLNGQIIILSTDEEIVGEYRESISDIISNTFVLNHTANGNTEILANTYFGGTHND